MPFFIKMKNWRIAFFLLLIAYSARTESDVKQSDAIQSGIKSTEINADNWLVILKDEWMVEFSAPWCPACRIFQSTWDHFSKKAVDRNVKVGKVNVLYSPTLKARFAVIALPTIMHVINGEVRPYLGPLDSEAMIKFIDQQEWQLLEPLTAWKEYEEPKMTNWSIWGSNPIIPLGFIVLGAILGQSVTSLFKLFRSSTKNQPKLAENEESKTQKEVIDDEVGHMKDDKIVDYKDAGEDNEHLAEHVVSDDELKEGPRKELDEFEPHEIPLSGASPNPTPIRNESLIENVLLDEELNQKRGKLGEFEQRKTPLSGTLKRPHHIRKRKPIRAD